MIICIQDHSIQDYSIQDYSIQANSIQDHSIQDSCQENFAVIKVVGGEVKKKNLKNIFRQNITQNRKFRTFPFNFAIFVNR